MVTRTGLAGSTWGTPNNPVRTNLPYSDQHGQLLTNLPDSWELEQGGPLPWLAEIGDSGRPPGWWVGDAREDGWSPIGPHGPWRHGSWARAVVTRCTELIIDPLVSDPFKVTRDRDINRPDPYGQTLPPPRWITDPQLLRSDDRVGRSAVPHQQRLARSTFYREWVRAALWHGMGYLLTTVRADGQPEAGTMRLVPHDAIWFDTDAPNDDRVLRR